MEHEGPPIDWDAFTKELLVNLPRTRWAERDGVGQTLLHFACYGSNVAAVVALLMSGLLDVNARNKLGYTPMHFAAFLGERRALEVLCTAGTDLRATNQSNKNPMDEALRLISSGACVRVLVANGVRLSTVHKDCRDYITPELVAFERGVLRCRAAVVAMLRVKRARSCLELWMWDKFLLVHMALEVWATRYAREWQN